MLLAASWYINFLSGRLTAFNILPSGNLSENKVWLPVIIGFALGIILSQKIGVSYDKFLSIEEKIISIYGNLRSLALILDNKQKKLGSKTITNWAKDFLRLLSDPKADNYKLHESNGKLYSMVGKIERQPSELAMLCGEITKDAAFCLSKKLSYH